MSNNKPTSKIELHHGDCLEVMKEIPDGSVDLTVTSPPYDNIRKYNGNNALWGEHVWKGVIQELFRLTKDGGVVVWIVGDATIKGSETGTSFKQALWAKERGFNLHDTMIWQKNAIPYDPKCERYWQAFEYMFVFSKGKPKCNYIKVPCKHAGKRKPNNYGQRRPDGTLRTDRHQDSRRIQATKVKDNIWYVPNAKQNGCHPASYPEQLVNDHILSWSNEGDTILDPFMGSGTTGVACKNIGRNFIGIELDPEYFEIAKKRIEEAK